VSRGSLKPSPSSPKIPDRTWVEIDRRALRHNLKAVRKMAGDGGIMAVVKANAYGHGLTEVAEILTGGVEVFAVASLGEALQLSRVIRNEPILLLSAALPDEYREIGRKGFIPTLSSVQEARLYARSAPKGAPVHFKVDTGMGRLGAKPEDALPTLKAILKAGLSVHSISTHLSSADSDSRTTKGQLRIFAKLLSDLQEQAPEASIHALNSAGTWETLAITCDNADKVKFVKTACAMRQSFLSHLSTFTTFAPMIRSAAVRQTRLGMRPMLPLRAYTELRL
jgi:alanine racemase